MMLNKLASRWWIVAIKGLLTIGFGAVIISFPLLILVSIVLLFGIDTLLDSVVISLALCKKNPRWRQPLIVGIISSIIGLAVIATSDIDTLLYLYMIALIAIMRGIFQANTASQRNHTKNGWLLYVAGMMSIGFGISTVVLANQGALVVLGLMAFYAIAIGLMEMIFAYYLRASFEASGVLAIRSTS